MKALIFLLGLSLTVASPVCPYCGEEKKMTSLDVQKLQLHEKYATFNGTDLENLGKRTFFWALSNWTGPQSVLSAVEYGNFDYKEFTNTVTVEEMVKRMVNDLKYAKEGGPLFASYGKAYQAVAEASEPPF